MITITLQQDYNIVADIIAALKAHHYDGLVSAIEQAKIEKQFTHHEQCLCDFCDPAGVRLKQLHSR